MNSDFNWIQVGELARSISENLLPDSDALTGRTLRLCFEDGSVIRWTFNGLHDLSWEVLEGPEKGARDDETFRATCIRPQIYLVDYILHRRQALSVSLVLDLGQGIATRATGRLPDQQEAQRDLFSRINEGMNLTGVAVQFASAAIDRPFEQHTKRHEPTDEMIGKRIQYVYSRTEAYEHIYLNDKLYTWHCLSGIEKGLADTDRCHHLKITEQLYLFVWREKIVPTLGVVLVDLQQMKTSGKLFGYEANDFGQLTNAPLGAYATLGNDTR